MNYLEFALFSAIIFPLFSNTDGADECRTQRLLCYDCDSRYDPYCGDPFNRSLPQELRPPAKVCHGCCVKFVHKFPDSKCLSFYKHTEQEYKFIYDFYRFR
ncbi:unnamed protein product [Orchesella dallaii]|uniref:Uncharacterized protein n=1 Tax=Orchesella dallaii TaxID=48710 RepID=A0ABP1S2J2_9HEXA